MKLSNKVALVTGGSRGIGTAIVKRLLEEGASVAFTYNSSPDAAEKLIKDLQSKGKVKAYRADAAKMDQSALVKDVINDFGKIDILVNNAGVFELGDIGEIDPKSYEKIMQINVTGVFALTNEVVKIMKPGSRIINISSALGERATGSGMSVYVASKFAVTGFSRAWAKDLGSKGILVNSVQPGPIVTDMNPDTGEFSDYMKSQTALGRYGKPDEIASAVVFLAGPDATYITGATLNVDGGWNA
jgi:3-oxoacyl-[acyl-carrier protein] reductase